MNRKAGWIIMAGLTVASGAARAEVEHLGQPCRAKNVLASIVVRDPVDGTDQLVLTNMNEAAGAELLFIDYRKNTGRVVKAPAGDGSWALNEVPGNRLVVGTYYDGMFMVYDLAKREWVKSVKFPGEDYIWNLAMGKDGRIYGGTYPGGKLGALDLDTYELEDCGAPARPNMYLRYVTATPDGRIFCQFGMDRNQTKIYDPDSKQWSDAPDYLQNVTQAVLWNGYFIFQDRVYEGRDLKPVATLPFPLPEGVAKWNVNIPLTSKDNLFFHADGALYRFKAGEEAPTLVSKQNLKGGGFTASAPDGSVLARRGQEYGWLKPGQSRITLKPYPVESAPRPTHFLALDPKGRLWGGPTFGQTVFWLDPVTKEYHNTSTVSNHGGEVFDAVFRGDSVFLTSYAGGEVIRYDTDRPFDQFSGRNPRTIHRPGPEYIRPTGGIAFGPDGRLYSGWMAKYGVYGGALAISDPDGGPGEIIRDPLGAVTIGGVAVDAKHVYLGTNLSANGLRNKPDTAPEFGVMDLATRKIVFRQGFPGTGAVYRLAVDPAIGRVAMIAGGKVALFDVATMKMVDLPEHTPKATAHTASMPGDGFYYYASGKSVVALNMRTGATLKVAEAPANIEHVAASREGDVFAACGVDVYRLRDGRSTGRR